MPKLTEELEVRYLVLASISILFTVTAIDWILTTSLIQANASPSTYAAYYLGLLLIGGAIIIPVAGLVSYLKEEPLVFVIWGLVLALPLLTGSEDLLYGAIWSNQTGGAMWLTWAWLNANPFIGWTNALFRTPSVSIVGLETSALLGWVIVAALLAKYADIVD